MNLHQNKVFNFSFKQEDLDILFNHPIYEVKRNYKMRLVYRFLVIPFLDFLFEIQIILENMIVLLEKIGYKIENLPFFSQKMINEEWERELYL